MGFLHKEDRAGIYLTLIAHLSVIIILLLAQIDSSIQKENSFVLDFTKQEEIERQQKEAEELIEKIERAERIREEIQAKIDRQLGSPAERAIKNVVVDRNGQLKDDRGTDVNKLYEDAEKIQNELRKGYSLPKGDYGDVSSGEEEEGDGDGQPAKQYSGASVLSWQLDGRRALSLPVPAYKCYGAGTITIIISVDRAGKVVEASVQNGPADNCIRNAAISAAKRSRFNADSSAPAKQTGNIIYEFIAQ
ncbi:MAG: energy transducer TonB [Bacteroidales bacterium]|nr:energy transducer TonB [Bacteroidales bacterium]